MSGQHEEAVYVWVIDGKPVTGTLARYARMWEQCRYSGDIYVPSRVAVWSDPSSDPVIHQVQVTQGAATEDDYLPYEIKVNGETAFVQIDGRS